MDFISVNRIIERVYANHAFEEHIDPIWILEHIGDCIDLLGCGVSYYNRVTGESELNPTIKVVNHVGTLPCDLAPIRGAILGVRDYCTKVVFREATDVYHFGEKDGRILDLSTNADYTYKTQNGQIETSRHDVELEISYLAQPLDTDGYPMVLNNTKVIRACEFYVAERIAYKLWLRGDLADNKYAKVEKEKLWAMGSATSAMDLPTIDQMESIKNSWLRLVPKINQHAAGFYYNGQQEQRRLL
jgi:hypothetical protein